VGGAGKHGWKWKMNICCWPNCSEWKWLFFCLQIALSAVYKRIHTRTGTHDAGESERAAYAQWDWQKKGCQVVERLAN